MNLEKHKTACGVFITVPSRVQSHLQAHPDVIAHLPDAISKIRLPRERKKIEQEISMGCVIGCGGVVKTDPIKISDRALFATRSNRKFASRVAPAGA